MAPIKVIFNPYSGRGHGRQLEARVISALNAAALDFELDKTEHPRHGIELAAQAKAEGFAIIAAVGGDGTVSEVVNGLAQVTPQHEIIGELGILPVGSGNDFTTMAGVPPRLEDVAQGLAAGKLRTVDLGHASWFAEYGTQSRYFDNNMGIGLEAAVTLESYNIRRLAGSALYLAAALRTLRTYTAPDIELTCELANGDRWQRHGSTLMISVGNSPRAGGGFYLTPHALLDDGLLDVGVADAVPTHRVLRLLPKALFGKHVSDSAWYMHRCRHVHIICAEGTLVQLDGEVVAQRAREVSIRAYASTLAVIV